MQVAIAENASALHAHTALEKINATPTLVAVRGNVGAAEELEFGHRRKKMQAVMKLAKPALH